MMYSGLAVKLRIVPVSYRNQDVVGGAVNLILLQMRIMTITNMGLVTAKGLVALAVELCAIAMMGF